MPIYYHPPQPQTGIRHIVQEGPPVDKFIPRCGARDPRHMATIRMVCEPEYVREQGPKQFVHAWFERYWVGDGGNWSDTAHWSDRSGGAGGQTVPNVTHNVHFDDAGFTGNNEVIVFPASTETTHCASWDMSGLTTYTITMQGSTDDDIWYLEVHDDVIFARNTTLINSHAIGNATYYALYSYGNTDGGGNEGWIFGDAMILVQAWDSTLATSVVLQNLSPPPVAGDFTATALWTDDTDAETGRFSPAPNGQVAYCNGPDNCIWAGSEMRCAAFLTSTAALTTASSTCTSPKDYTDIINNTKSDNANVAVIGGGDDTYSVLLLHLDGADEATTFTDSGATGHSPTANSTGAAIDTDQAKFGTGSLLLDGTDDYIQAADHANWNFGTGLFTIDMWLYATDWTADQGLYGQYVDADNYVLFYVTRDGSDNKIHFDVKSGGVSLIALSNTITGGITGTWHHFAVVRGIGGGADDFGVYMDGERPGMGISDSITMPDLGAVIKIGCANDKFAGGWIDEVRVSKGIARWTADFDPPVRPYSPSQLTWLVGSTRPLKGVKFYIANANTIANTLTVKEFNGATWNALTVTADATASGGASLAQTGAITWASTVDTSTTKYLEGYLLYWYQFTIDAGEADIYKATVDAPFQGIKDLWDGNYREPAAFYKYTTSRLDNTLNVREDKYDSTDDTTYCVISALSSSGYLEIGFTEKITGLLLKVAPGKENSNNVTATVSYWNGTEYVSVGTVSDETFEDGGSLYKPGALTWANKDLYAEQRRVITARKKKGSGVGADSVPLYYYQLKWSGTLDEACYLYYVGGITAMREIKGYRFPVHAADRLMLCSNSHEKENEMLISASFAPDVWNGDDFFTIEVGEDNAITCAAPISATYTSNIYNLVLVYKANETWILKWTVQQPTGDEEDGTAETTIWERYQISSVTGCPAAATLCTASVAFENNINNTKMIAIWQGHDGIYISDGRAPLKVSNDISTVFDQSETPHITLPMMDKSAAFVDHHRLEYHWLWATDCYAITFGSGAHEVTAGETVTGATSGATGVVDHLSSITGAWGSGTAAGTLYVRSVTGTWQNGEVIKQGTDTVATAGSVATLVTAAANLSLDKEYVLDMKRWRWFEIDRGTGNRLQCGTSCEDSYGNKYAYGCIDSGYMERLEYGVTFDGTDISNIIEVGDQLPIPQDMLTETRISKVNLVCVPKNSETSVTVTHKIDGATTGTDYTVSQADTTHEFANVIKDIYSLPGIFHSFKLAIDTDAETKGFEPIYLSAYFTRERDHLS